MRISRRSFLKVLAGTAASLGLSQSEIANVLEKALALPKAYGGTSVVWLTGDTCGGCTTAFAGVFSGEVDYADQNGDNYYGNSGLLQAKAFNPDLTTNALASTTTLDDAALDILDIDFISVIMGPSGELASSVLKYYKDTATNSSYVVVVEGAIPDDDFCEVGYYGGSSIGIRTWGKAIAQKAAAVIAYGTCASFGNVPAALNRKYNSLTGEFAGGRNGTNAEGVPSDWNSTIVRVPVCPGHPEALLFTIVDYLNIGSTITLSQFVNNLDSEGRPKTALVVSSLLGQTVYLYGQTLHASPCPRLQKYSERVWQRYWGDSREGCLEMLGCNGPNTYSPCHSLKWNRQHGKTTCIEAGMVCIGCAQRTFPDATLKTVYQNGNSY